MRIFILFLLLGVITACDRGNGPDTDSRQTAESAPTVAYTRRMIFVGGRVADPAIVVFDHLALAGPTAVERRAGFWRATGEDWEPLLDLKWADDPIREPWRLVPHGPFRFLVDDAGEVEALLIRGDTKRFRLAPLGRIGTWNPDDLPFVRFQLGELVIDADSSTGLLVDLQPGAATEENDSALSELVLTDGADLHLVVRSPDDRTGELWLQRAERSETMTGIVLTPTDSAGIESWRIDSMLSEIAGQLNPAGSPLELRYETNLGGLVAAAEDAETDSRTPGTFRAADSATLPAAESTPGPALIQVVRGWIEVRGERRTVFGVMRRAPA